MANVLKMLKLFAAFLIASGFMFYVSNQFRPGDTTEGAGLINSYLTPVNPILEPAPCDGSCLVNQERVTLVVSVISDVGNFAARKAIRQTWGSADSLAVMAGGNGATARLIFILAIRDNQEMVHLESKKYGDILQGDFHDTYSNLPLKVFAGMQWFLKKCPDAKFMFKIDDDVFLNPFLLRSRVIAQIDEPREMAIYGRAWVHTKSVYPAYVTGPAYLLTGPSVPALYDAASGIRYMPIEDVFFTGIVADSIGIPLVGLGQQFYDDSENIGLESEEERCAAVNSFVAIHKLSPSTLEELWNVLWRENINLCTRYTWSDNNWSLFPSYFGRHIRKPKT